MYKPIPYSALFVVCILFTSCEDTPTGSDSDTGTAEVLVTTTGSQKSADGYILHIDDSSEEEISVSDQDDEENFENRLSLSLDSGSHEIELTGVAPNCSVESENPVTISVKAGKSTSVEFSVRCEAALNNKVVFVSDRDGPTDLYVADPGETPAEGFSNYKKLTNDDYLENNPAIASDGTRIAYEHSGNIWVINADGTGATQLTDSRTDKKPIWISGNTKLAFISEREGVARIYSMNADGSDQTAFPTKLPIHDINDCDDNDYDIHPSQKAVDSSCDLVVSMGEGEGTEIGWIDIDSDDDGIVDELTNNDHFDGYPALSPDGSELLIVVEDKEGIKNLRIIDAETGETLSTSDFERGFIDDQAYPSWSHDGSEIIFTSVNQARTKSVSAAAMAQDYNSSRSNKPRTTIDTDKTDFNVRHIAWSPAW